MAKAAPTIELTAAMIDTIQRWDAVKKEIEDAKSRELALRLELIKMIPFADDKDEGGQTVKLGAGWKLALDKPMDYKMEPKNRPAVEVALNALAAVNPAIMPTLVRWEPVMSVKAYKTLTDDQKIILTPVVTIKPGTPSLELKPPPTPRS